MKAQVGFIGLGNMGYGMVKNLLSHNFSILAYDIDQEKLNSAVEIGAEKAKNIQKIANSVNIVILALPHPDISREVIRALSHGKVKTILETSTLTPKDSQFLQSELDKKGINYLCAPMLAGKQMALEGRIHFIVEGKKEIFKQYQDVFVSMGKTTFMGGVPKATLAKLAYNICRYSNVATALTIINFLKQYSKNLAPIYKVLVQGSLDNFGQVWKEEMGEVAIQDKPYKFAGNKIPAKDLSLVIDMAQEKGIQANLFKEIKKVYDSM